MNHLLDTHTLLWYLLDDENLSPIARRTIDTQECFYSKVSLWEIAIKQSIGKLRYKETIPSIVQMCKEENFINMPVTEHHFEHIKRMPFIHHDPFDRLLIAQAQLADMTLITKDRNIARYDINTLW